MLNAVTVTYSQILRVQEETLRLLTPGGLRYNGLLDVLGTRAVAYALLVKKYRHMGIGGLSGFIRDTVNSSLYLQPRELALSRKRAVSFTISK